ncbi:cell surface protein [Lachnospiraceae bacterium KM106-2]|nr:cell surface protein [Lachnospiraceae bacterium KM106-2]
MSNITNIANVNQYTYNVGTTTKPITDPIFSQVTNTFKDPQVVFTKICTPEFADLNQTITITYQVQNIDNQIGSPVIGTITITDPFLTESIPFINISIESNVLRYDQPTGTFQMLIPSGGLAPGNTTTATFTYVVSPGYNFSTSLTSTATAAFTLSPAGALSNRFATCGTTINNGTLEIAKSVTPTTDVSSGATLTYTIAITNTGNVPSTIPINAFVDPVPAGTQYIQDTISPVNYFDHDTTNNAITNVKEVTIPPNSPAYNISFSVRVL